MNSMANKTTKMTKKQTIEVRGDELQFIMENEPTAFARTIAESLTSEGYPIDRVKVHQELRTIKKQYDRRIIEKARYLLKVLGHIDHNPYI